MKTFFFILRYIKYFFTAKTKFAAQAPFLYDFISNVLNKKCTDEEFKRINFLRKTLYKSKKEINITDFGAGSHINQSKKRKISDIAKNSAKNEKFGKLLYRIIQYYKPQKILELGTSLGISTLYLAKAKKDAKIYTFEGCQETAKIAKNNFKTQNAKNIKLILGAFEATLDKNLKKIKQFDLIFVDGNHQEKSTISYFEKCLQYTHNNTIFIFDDIHWSKGMEKAWDYIKSNKKTTLTIDLFYIGIVFVKAELSKENHIIRF